MKESAQAKLVGRGPAAALLVVMTTVAYLPALSCGFIWDDDAHVTESPPVKDLDGLRDIWLEPGSVPQYYPLTHSSFWVEYRLWGERAAGYHAVNIALHVMAVLLLWRLLVRLEIPGGWLAAAIFAVHPVHVESVAWISERKNVLSAVFYLAAAIAWFDWAERPARSARWRWAGAMVLFAAALLSKSVTASLPVALLVTWWWRTGRLDRRVVAGVLPMVALAIPMGLLTIWAEQNLIGTRHVDLGLAPADRLLVAGRALWFYAGKLAWPDPLAFIYPRWTIDAGSVVAWLFPAGAAAVIAALWCGRRWLGRGPLAGVLFFAGTLVPALGFIDVYPLQYSFVADHFQYLASLGLIVLAASGIFRLSQRWGTGRRTRPGELVPVAVLLLLAGLTWRQCGIYQDRYTLWTDTGRKNAGSKMVQTSLGNELGKRGLHRQAAEHHRLAIAVDEDYAVAHMNLSIELAHLGETDEAFKHAQQAVDLDEAHTAARLNLVLAHVDRGNYDQARKELQEARRREPRNRRVLEWIERLREMR